MSRKALFLRMRYDFGQELVVLSCSLVLVGLFFYIFNDFINFEMARISSSFRDGFAQGFAAFVLMIVSCLVARNLGEELVRTPSFSGFAQVVGERRLTVLRFRVLSVLTDSLILLVPAWWVVNTYLTSWSLVHSIFYAVAQLTFIAIAAWFDLHVLRRLGTFQDVSPILGPNQISQMAPLMVVWRLKQFLFRNRVSQLFLGFSILLSGFGGVLANGVLILHPGIICIVYLAGLFAATSLCFQVSRDFAYAWAERSCGVSHSTYLKALNGLSTVPSMISGLLSLLFIGVSSGWGLSAAEYTTIFFVGFVPPFLLPDVAFQIDIRRPAILAMTVALVSLFLCSAIYASVFSIFLLPVVKYYGNVSQRDRFYRA